MQHKKSDAEKNNESNRDMDLFDAPAYWGRITREDAEEVLEKFHLQNGLYLIREKFEEAGIYAISVCYLKRCYHYRIERLKNDYVVLSGSRVQEKFFDSMNSNKQVNAADDRKTLQFSNPVELISYFQTNTEPLVTKLTIPCSRPESHNFVQYWCAPLLDPDLYIKKIHHEAVLNDPDVSMKDKLTSKRYIYERRVLQKLHESEPWFHAKISRSEAEARLRNVGAKNGLFLIREKTADRPNKVLFTLSLCFQTEYHHYLIEKSSEEQFQVVSADKLAQIPRFGSIVQLVDFYHRFHQDIACRLRFPCARPGGSMCITTPERFLGQPYFGPVEPYTFPKTTSTSSGSNLKTYYIEPDPEKLPLLSPISSSASLMSVHQYFIDEKYIRLGEKLGEGQFGEVFKGKLVGCDVNNNGKLNQIEDVAVKQIKSNEDSFSKDMYEEAERMLNLNHPYIVNIFGLCKHNQSVSILLELCPYGAMNQWLRDNKNFRMKYILNYMYQVCDGMCYLHRKSIIHRDLALRNILIMSKKICKISDFGLSRFLEANTYYQIGQNRRLPSMWYPPEVLESALFHSEIDIWSFGVTTWEATSYGETPYRTEFESNTLARFQPMIHKLLKFLSAGNRLKKPDKCPDDVYAVILKCWEWDKHQRPSFDEIKKHLKRYILFSDDRIGQESNDE